MTKKNYRRRGGIRKRQSNGGNQPCPPREAPLAAEIAVPLSDQTPPPELAVPQNFPLLPPKAPLPTEIAAPLGGQTLSPELAVTQNFPLLPLKAPPETASPLQEETATNGGNTSKFLKIPLFFLY